MKPLTCDCGARATCFGAYEGGKECPSCDACCGHGNEDGRCQDLYERDDDEQPDFDSPLPALEEARAKQSN